MGMSRRVQCASPAEEGAPVHMASLRPYPPQASKAKMVTPLPEGVVNGLAHPLNRLVRRRNPPNMAQQIAVPLLP